MNEISEIELEFARLTSKSHENEETSLSSNATLESFIYNLVLSILDEKIKSNEIITMLKSFVINRIDIANLFVDVLWLFGTQVWEVV